MRLPRINLITWQDVHAVQRCGVITILSFSGARSNICTTGELEDGFWYLGYRSSNLAPISRDSWTRLLHLNKKTLAVFDRPAMWPRKQFRAFENHAGTSTWRGAVAKSHVPHAFHACFLSVLGFCRRRLGLTSPWPMVRSPRSKFHVITPKPISGPIGDPAKPQRQVARLYRRVRIIQSAVPGFCWILVS
jgi:hypothetical protein